MTVKDKTRIDDPEALDPYPDFWLSWGQSLTSPSMGDDVKMDDICRSGGSDDLIPGTCLNESLET